MKKIYSTFIAVVAITHFSFGQWTLSGGYLTTSNQVGIGNTAPQSGFLLDVNGQTVLRNKLYINDNLIDYGANQNYTISETGNSWITKSTGNLGIGTSSPAYKLDVQGGSVNTSGSIIIGNNSAGSTNRLYLAGTDLYHSIYSTGSSGNNTYFGEYLNGVSTSGFHWVNSAAGADVMTLNGLGNLGIGTTTPRAKLSVLSGSDNNGAFFPAANAVIVGPDNGLTSLSSNLAISSNTTAGANIGASIGLGGLWLGAGDVRDLEFATIKGAKENSTAGDGSAYLAFGTYGSGGMTEKMRISSTGSLAIGVTNTNGYKLAVNGSAIATSVKVTANNGGPWPDYVLAKSYILPSLRTIKIYIDKNQHLPDLPSANEVAKEGQDLGDMNKLLLKKVEELTLYLIEKDKNEKLQAARMSRLEKRLEAIEKSKH